MNRLGPASLLSALFLVGCNGSQPLTPSALLPVKSAETNEAASPPAAAAMSPAVKAVAPPPAASRVSLAQARVELAPIVGSTVQAVAPLSARLASRARASGYRLAAMNDPAATEVLKGYFSAFSDGGQTTIVYVWDVLDPAGNRLHRIQGQERSPGASSRADAWSAVTPETMQTIADRTIDELTAYLTKPAG